MKLNIDANMTKFPPLYFFFVSSLLLSIFPDFIGDHFMSVEHFLCPVILERSRVIMGLNNQHGKTWGVVFYPIF